MFLVYDQITHVILSHAIFLLCDVEYDPNPIYLLYYR
jgi:hypothetical protein